MRSTGEWVMSHSIAIHQALIDVALDVARSQHTKLFSPLFSPAISDRLVRLWQYSNQACSVRVSAPSGLGFGSWCTVCSDKSCSSRAAKHQTPPLPAVCPSLMLSFPFVLFFFASFHSPFLALSSPLFSKLLSDAPRVAYCFRYITRASVVWHSCSRRSPQPRKNGNKSIWALNTSGKLTN